MGVACLGWSHLGRARVSGSAPYRLPWSRQPAKRGTEPCIRRRVMFDVVEASIADLRAALESGATTAVEVVEAYLARIDRYDGADTGTALNSVVVRSPDALAEAAASDARRKHGAVL